MFTNTSKTREAYAAFMRGEFGIAKSIYWELALTIGYKYFKANIVLCARRLAALRSKNTENGWNNRIDSVIDVSKLGHLAHQMAEQPVKTAVAPIDRRVVLFTHDHTQTRYFSRIRRIAKALKEIGLEVVLCLVRPGQPFEVNGSKIYSRSETILEGFRYIYNPFPGNIPQCIEDHLKASVKIYIELLMEYRPEIVIAADDFTSALPMIIAAKKLSLPVIKEQIHYADAFLDKEIVKYFSRMSFVEKYALEQICLNMADRSYYLFPDRLDSQEMFREVICQVIKEKSCFDLEVSLLPKGINTIKSNIDDIGLYYLELDVEDESGGNSKGVLVSFRFFSTKGKLLVDTLPGFSSSKTHRNYRYVDTLRANGSSRVLIFSIPKDIHKIEIDVVANATIGTLKLRKAKFGKVGVQDVARWLSLAIPGVHWIKDVETYIHREGATSLRLALLNYKYSLTQHSSDFAKLNGAIQEMVELDRTWVPDLSCNGKTIQVSETSILTVVHLHKTAYPYENSGGAIRCLNTVLSQQRIGMDPYIITPIGYPGSAGKVGSDKYEVIEGIEHYRIGANVDGIKGISLPDRTSYSVFHIAKILKSRGACVIHAASGVRGYELALQGLALKKITGLPVLYEVRSFHEHTWTTVRNDVMNLEKTKLRMIKEDFCMAEADLVTTISCSMKKILIERGVSPEKIEVIPNAIDETKYIGKEFKPIEIPELKGADFVVGYVSNMSCREGHHYLIQAIFQLKKLTGLNIKGFLVGDGPERNSLQQLATELGLEKTICFPGEVDHAQINAYYKAIDLFVIPRIPDYAADWVTPLKPYEAMALERPIIVTNLPALREVVGENEERGLIAEPRNVNSLVEKLQSYINDPIMRQKKVKTAKEWVFAERTWSANAKRYESIYRRLINNNKNGLAAVSSASFLDPIPPSQAKDKKDGLSA